MHAAGQRFGRVVISATRIGKDQERVPVERPVAAQFLTHRIGQWQDPVLVPLAVADEQFVFLTFDVVNGEPETFAEPQPATIDKLERSAIAAQADVGQEVMDLLAGENLGQGVVIFGADLREDRPVGMPEEIDEEHAGGGAGLANGLGRPMLLELYEQEVVAQLGLGNGRRITPAVFMDEPHLTVVGVPGSIGIIAQSQVLGKPHHRWVGMLVINWVGIVSCRSPNGSQGLRSPLVRGRAIFACFMCRK